MKERLDILLVNKNLAPSREKAKALIMAGVVYVEGQKEDKAGTTFEDTVSIEVRGASQKYVSRGGLKLEKAMTHFGISLEGKVCMDVGASTGGFTDCMLQNGAVKVYGVDAAKLPQFTCAGQEVQMASFSGCKLMGVNAYSQHPEWAARLAQWITSQDNQTRRFELRGQGPSNINAAASPQVQDSPAIAALLAQSEFSQLQRVGGKFWDPVTEFAGNMALGNPSGASIQAQMDRMVEGVTAR